MYLEWENMKNGWKNEEKWVEKRTMDTITVDLWGSFLSRAQKYTVRGGAMAGRGIGGIRTADSNSRSHLLKMIGVVSMILLLIAVYIYKYY